MKSQVTLMDMLDAREQRAMKQNQLLQKYQSPLICFTMNIAGPQKNNSLIQKGFKLGNQFLKQQLTIAEIEYIHYEEIRAFTGNEAYYVINEDPLAIKKITSSIEDSSALGRLFDMDVLRNNGQKVDRSELDLPPRHCLICGGPAKECARSRSHTVEELQEQTKRILLNAINDPSAKHIASLACRALLYEVCTTPKPGLVDRANSGSHKDMDIFTFVDSTCALWPYFEKCFLIGRDTANLPASRTFTQLRQAGIQAEKDMFSATHGVNTHKGAVFSIGILCAAYGRLRKEQWKCTEIVLNECAEMTKGLVASDFADLTEENACTIGQKLYLHHKITGVRGQMEEGLPAVRNAGLPVLKNGISQGFSINDAGCAALLALIVSATDTNLISRSDISTQREVVQKLKEILREDPYPDHQMLQTLDQDFIQRNLSPGGSADLLAICYLLYFVENEV